MSATVDALLHDPTEGTRPVTVHAAVGALRIQARGLDRSVRASALSVSAGGWHGDAIHLAWNEEGRARTLTIDDPRAAAALAAALPEPVAGEIRRHLDRGRGARRRGHLALWVVTILALVPVALIVLLFTMRDRILGAAVRRLPPSVDVQVGGLVEEQVSATTELVESGPASDAVRAIGERLVAAAPPQPFEFRFHVARTPEINAFAVPGGFVVVNTGLLAAADSPDEVAGVLAHELTHVLHRHSMRQLVFRMGLATAVQILLGSPDVLTGAALELTSLGFSRDQERDADLGGLELLERARLPPEGMARFFERLAKEGPQMPALLSSHPGSEDRATTITREVERRGRWKTEPIATDWAAVKNQVGAGP